MATGLSVYGEEVSQLVEGGLTPDQAFTLVRDKQNASNGITSIGYASPPASQLPMTDRERSGLNAQIAIFRRIVKALTDELVPAYLTEDDVEQITNRAIKDQ